MSDTPAISRCLLDLPWELRLMIWDLVLFPGNDCRFAITQQPAPVRPDGMPWLPVWQYPALLQTCRLVRRDAIRPFFSQARFYIPTSKMFEPFVLRWMRSLDQTLAVPLIRDIVFGLQPVSPRGTTYCLERFFVYVGDNIPHHGFRRKMFTHLVPHDWTDERSDVVLRNLEYLHKLLDEPRVIAAGGGRKLCSDAWWFPVATNTGVE